MLVNCSGPREPTHPTPTTRPTRSTSPLGYEQKALALDLALAPGDEPPPAEHTDGFSLQKGSIVTVAIFFSGVLVYQLAPREGQSSAITNLINKWTSKPEDWEEINTAHALAAKQAGFDRNLFENVTPTNRWVDVAYPE